MDTDNYQNQLDTVNGWIKAADQKISIFIAIIVGTAGFFSEQLIALFTDINQGHWVAVLAFSAWIVTLGWALVKLILVLTPSTKNKGGSVLYFGHISAMNATQYSKKITKLSKKKYEQALIEQIYTNSKIATRKHRLLAESVKIMLGNLVLLGVTLAVIGVS